MIERQFAHQPKLAGELAKYGVEGTVQIYSATAIRVYLLATLPLFVGFSVAGLYSVVIAMFALVVLVGVLGIIRLVSAGRAGREWRRNQTGTSGANRLS